MATTSSAPPVCVSFGDGAAVAPSLSALVRGMTESEILRIAGEVRARAAAGTPVCDLTVGDFSPRYFPVPEELLEGVRQALAAGETNYPPPDGLPALRQAITAYTAAEHGVEYPIESVVVASGVRPLLYAAFLTVVERGDQVVYGVPAWNTSHYVWLSGARGLPVPCRRERGFHPTLDQLAPHLPTATLVCLCSPANPTGTMIEPQELARIARAIIEENSARARRGERPLFLLYDQVYGSLALGGNHANPVALVPDAAPWTIVLDGISKAFAATGLRVGWSLAAPAVTTRIRDLLGHVGAWAPRPEQVATARFLQDREAIRRFRERMDRSLRARLDALYHGFMALHDEGYPVDCVRPQGAMYLSLGLDLVGRQFRGRRIGSNEELRRLLLEEAGLAMVPFQAFGLAEETGWFRLSVGAVSLEEIGDVFPRLRALLEQMAD